jgi:hypothetical protein
VERRAEVKLYAGQLEEVPPQAAGEDRVPITDDGIRVAVQVDDPSKKAQATEATVYGWLSGMKCAYFENRSTTVRITERP